MKIEEGYYQHYKGRVYLVVGIAHHSETLESMVVYKAMYESRFGSDALWVRPESMWAEEVEVDGRFVPRFRPISGEEALEIGAQVRYK